MTNVSPITASKVPEAERMGFLSAAFGRYGVLVEACVYNSLAWLCEDYSGGYWEFYRLNVGGGYMVPCGYGEALHLVCPENYYGGTMSSEAAGLVATLYAVNQVVWRTRDPLLADVYDVLRRFAVEHAEASEILAAID